MDFTKLIDILTGKTVCEYYNLYCKTQWYSEEEMEAFQLAKLRVLIKHCYENVPYYRKLINSRKIDINNIHSISVLEQFPILTKEIIQQNYTDFIPLNNNKIKGVKTKQTGGTTGNILFNRVDAKTRSSTWGGYKRYTDWMGYKSNEKVLVLMGGHVKKTSYYEKFKSQVNSFLTNETYVDIYDTSEQTVNQIISLLESNNFSHIRSYPQFLFSIAQHMNALNKSLHIKSISSTAEPVMSEHRDLFRQVFNAEVFDQYGCGEIGGIAYECDRHNGLHIAGERAIIEVNDKNELLITDLDNFTMPFIRYWNADQAIISNEKCSCGRQGKIIKQIMGRTCDYIIGINGQYLHWAYFWHLIFDSNIASKRNLQKFQIVQNSSDTLTIRLVSDIISEEESSFIFNDIQKRVGQMNITIKYEKEIENTKTGKYRPVINNIINNINNQK